MELIHFSSIGFILLALLAACISGRFRRDSLNVANAIILPAGIVGTSISFISILANLEDPAMVAGAVFVACLPTFYAAIIKFCFGMVVSAEKRVDPGAAGGLGSVVWMVLIGSAIAYKGTFLQYINPLAFGFFLLSVVITGGLTRASKKHAMIDPLVRLVPCAGLIMLYSGILLLLLRLDDASRMGPVMAFGLLGHLYCILFSVWLNLLRPDLVEPGKDLSRWMYWGASLLGITGILGIPLAILS